MTTLSIVEVKTLEPTIHTVLLIGCGEKSQILWDLTDLTDLWKN